MKQKGNDNGRFDNKVSIKTRALSLQCSWYCMRNDTSLKKTKKDMCLCSQTYLSRLKASTPIKVPHGSTGLPECKPMSERHCVFDRPGQTGILRPISISFPQAHSPWLSWGCTGASEWWV